MRGWCVIMIAMIIVIIIILILTVIMRRKEGTAVEQTNGRLNPERSSIVN